MGKLKDLAAVHTARAESFVYVPPAAAFVAARILIKLDMAYPQAAPVTVSVPVLAAVMRGLRRANPLARIVLVEHAAPGSNLEAIFTQLGVVDLFDEEVRGADIDILIMRDYANRLPQPARHATLTAPEYVADYDCVISVSAFKRGQQDGQPVIAAALHNLVGLAPDLRAPVADGHVADAVTQKDLYFTLGHHVDSAVVDLTHKLVSADARVAHGEAVPVGQVVWGDDLLAVDETACRIAGEPAPALLADLRALREQLQQAG
ncbi:MAG: DUF362 domain-containing protein [Chloroflexota bacterium]